MRIELKELHDQDWFPTTIRDEFTDALQAVLNFVAAYAPIAPRLGSAIAASGTHRVVDLCSGGGGPWPWLQKYIGARHGVEIEVCLTDRHPNLSAFDRARTAGRGAFTFCAESVDACHVPEELAGFRTMFTSMHHFQPDDVVAVLQNAIDEGQGIAMFDVSTRHVLTILSVFLAPLGALVTTPFIRPFRWSRLLWTYAIPVIPFALWLDGIVSCLRAYSPAELRELAARLPASNYKWEIGEESRIRGVLPVTYIVGYPT